MTSNARLRAGRVILAANPIFFQRRKQTLYYRVVLTITLAAHAARDVYPQAITFETRRSHTLRHVVSGRATLAEKQAASLSEVGRFGTEMLSERRNLTALMKLSAQWIDQVHCRRTLNEFILDMDSSVSETYGRQQGTAYNGHFESLCFHPLFLFNQLVDLEKAMLRRRNKALAKFWRRVLLPIIVRYRRYDISKFFRHDAAFALLKLMRLLDDEGYQCAIRIKTNAVLERQIEYLLIRPVGRPSYKPKVLYRRFQYQPKPWQRARRAVTETE